MDEPRDRRPFADGAAEIARLNTIIRALMDRAERSASAEQSEFARFESSLVLGQQVRQRTAELEEALRENERVNRALRESEAKFRGLVSQSMVGIVIVDAGRISYANPKFAEIFGYAPEEVLGLSPLELVVDADRPTVVKQLRRRIDGEVDRVAYTFQGRRADATVIDVECHGSCMDIDGHVVLISLLMDISERAQAERAVRILQEQLRDQSEHDALTGLFNRRYLEQTLSRELSDANLTARTVSIIMADLDHFKAVNDRLGHPAGDDVLRAFSATLRRHARRGDICCRYGGEEFLLVLSDTPLANALERAELLRTATSGTPIDSAGTAVTVTASFGVATAPVHGRTADELIAAADEALYTAKRAGRNRVSAASRDKHATPRRLSAPQRQTSSAATTKLPTP